MRAGLLVLLLFLGNVAIKPATSPLIRRFGFRSVLIGSIAGGLVVLAGLALVRPETPLPLTAGLLVLTASVESLPSPLAIAWSVRLSASRRLPSAARASSCSARGS